MHRLALASLLLGAPALADPPHGPAAAQVSACFVPAESCTLTIADAIDAARSEVRVQAYGFTSPPVLKALADAKRRGVDVAVILDRSNQEGRYTGATFMAHAGVPVWIDTAEGIAHSKVIVIDRRLVIGGSFNYTLSADARNVENVTFIDSPEVAAWFLKAWDSRRAEALAFAAD